MSIKETVSDTTAQYFCTKRKTNYEKLAKRLKRKRHVPLLKDQRFIQENEGQELWRGGSAMRTGVCEREIETARAPQAYERSSGD